MKGVFTLDSLSFFYALVLLRCALTEGLAKVTADRNKAARIASAESNCFSTLLSWSETGNHPDFEIVEYRERGYGIRALREFKEGEIILSIPRNRLLTANLVIENLFEDEHDADFASESVNANTWPELVIVLFSAFLLHESQNIGETKCNDTWTSYYSSLPLLLNVDGNETIHQRRIANLPILLKDLSPLYPYRKVFLETHKLQQLMLNYKNGLDANVSDDQWLMTIALVKSRIHSIWSIDRFGDWAVDYSLIPVADLLNAAPHGKENVKCFTNQKTEAFDCSAIRSIPKNAEILVAYGPQEYGKAEMFTTYGFSWLDDGTSCMSLECNLENIRKEVDRLLLLQSLYELFLGGPFQVPAL